MVTLLSSPSFPYDIDTFTLTGGSSGTSIDVTISIDGEEILSTSLTYNTEGTIKLTDLATLLSTHLDSTPATLKIVAGRETHSCTLLPCRVPLDCPAAKWVKSRPLTLTTGAKTCALADKQFFALYGTGYTVRLRSRYGVIATSGDQTAAPAGGITTEERDGLTLVTLDWTQLDFYGDLPEEFAQGFTAVVECVHYASDGTTTDQPVISLTFHVIVPPYGSETIVFRNAFGQWETMLFAAVTQKDKPTRSAGTFEGNYKNYLVTAATTFEGVSFSLADGELPTAADFLEATTLARLAETTGDTAAALTIANPLTLTDGELETESVATAMPRLKATWREQRRHPRRGGLPANVFDSTFDTSFE